MGIALIHTRLLLFETASDNLRIDFAASLQSLHSAHQPTHADLQVRKDLPEINMQLIREVMDKRVIGMASKPLPDSIAKRRMAVTVAARAVAVALTPGLPPLQRVSILPRGNNMSRMDFMPQVRPALSPS